MIVQGLASRTGDDFPVLVVGAGPVGLVLALELRRRGIEVRVLAGGVDGYSADFQDLAEAEIVDPRRHAPMRLAVRRALGGTSLLWGGRCVPFDDVDFADRPHVPGGGWPLRPQELGPWYAAAMPYFDAGPAAFEAPVPELAAMPDCRLDRLERWSNAGNLRRLHAEILQKDGGLQVCLGAVATGLDIDPVTGRAAGVRVALPSGERTTLAARAIVLACGGLETTRLMLAARMAQPRLFGGPGGALGRYYMGHLEGRIADIVFEDPVAAGALDFYLDEGGRYARRRITISAAAQRRHGLLNMAGWPDNPPLNQPGHRSAILSLAYLSLATPGLGGLLAPDGVRRKHLDGGVRDIPAHLRNIVLGLPEAVREGAKFLYGRYLAQPRLPGFFIPNRPRRYAFFYHAEQAPNPESRVTLGGRRDALGMPRLRVDLRYGEIDAHSVAASHAVIDRDLRAAGIARLEYAVPEGERVASALAQAADGYHQIGTTRMSEAPGDGVVDPDCRVHGANNLFVASSSVFPTSGQANPTLLAATLAARLAAHVAGVVGDLPEPATAPVHRQSVMADPPG